MTEQNCGPACQCHGQIALDDPERDFLIPLPGSILYQNPALLFALFTSHLHRTVIIFVCNLHFRRAGFPNRLCPRRRRTLRHKHPGAAPEQLRCPGNALPVISVGGRCKGDLRYALSDLCLLKSSKVRFLRIQPQTPAQNAKHSVCAAQPFEGVESEPAALILYINPADSQLPAEVTQ